MVYGAGLPAALHSLLTGSMFIHNGIYYDDFEHILLPPGLARVFGVNMRSMRTPAGQKLVGIPKREVWERVVFDMSLSGNAPMSGNVFSARVEGDLLKLVTKDSKQITIRFKRLMVFDKAGFLGPDSTPSQDVEKVKILDWFNVRSGACHEYDLIETEDEFVNKVYFYGSRRIDGNHDKKDLVSVSYLTEDQARSPDYSDLVARYKITHLMRQAGIRGRKNGFDPQRGTQRYHSIKLECARREVFRSSSAFYQDTENVKFYEYDDLEYIEEKREQLMELT